MLEIESTRGPRGSLCRFLRREESQTNIVTEVPPELFQVARVDWVFSTLLLISILVYHHRIMPDQVNAAIGSTHRDWHVDQRQYDGIYASHINATKMKYANVLIFSHATVSLNKVFVILLISTIILICFLLS